MKPTTSYKAFIFFPRAKKKNRSVSYTQSKSTVLALALTILPSLREKSSRHFCCFLFCFVLKNIYHTEDASLSEGSVCKISGLAVELPAHPPLQRQSTAPTPLPPHLQNGDNTTHFRILCRPIFAKHFENERCCLSTERWPQNLQAVFLKLFIPFHIKASYLQSLANICCRLKPSVYSLSNRDGSTC